MIRKLEVDLIHLEWEGPFTPGEIARFDKDPDYGVYQIYGTHNVFGSDALLYIGQAYERTFAHRIPEHDDWISWQAGSTQIYLGRLCGVEPMIQANWPKWKDLVDRAEKTLIYFCSPPYNSSGLRSLRDMPPTIVANYKRRHRLPQIVSNVYESAPFADLKPYGSEPPAELLAA